MCRSLLAVLATSVLACATPAQPTPEVAKPTSAKPLPQLPPPSAPDTASRGVTVDGVQDTRFQDAPDEALALPDRPTHEAARKAAHAGRFSEAKRLLGRLAVAYPEHQVLVEQYNAVVRRLGEAQAASKAALEGATLLTPTAPPTKHTTVTPAPVAGGAPVPKLARASETKNAITDEEAWFERNGLRLPSYFVPSAGDFLFARGEVSSVTVAGVLGSFHYTEWAPSKRFLEADLPLSVPLAYGTMPLTRAIDSAPYTIAIYAERVVAVLQGDKVVSLLDFASFAHPPASVSGTAKVGEATLTTGNRTLKGDITVATETITHKLVWALARDGVLYVSHANVDYAKENKGQNAFVSALALDSGALHWRSAPLVSNAGSFALVGGGLVSGYGFTAEPDFVYVLDRATGAVKQKLPVRTGPDHVVEKGGRVYVRTYDADYVFDVK